MKPITSQETHLYFHCAHCNKHKFRYDHLLEPRIAARKAGPWYCDKCYVANHITIADDGTLDVTFNIEDLCTPTTEVLSLDPKVRQEDFWLLVKGMEFSKHRGTGDSRYFYEEHTCPINYMHSIEEVIVHGSTDPHGIFNWVKTLTIPRRQEIRQPSGLLVTEMESVQDWMERADEVLARNLFPDHVDGPRWWQR